MDGSDMPSPPVGYKPRKCAECRKFPKFGIEDIGPIWRCECGAFTGCTPTLECKGKPALPTTHALRAESFALFRDLIEHLLKNTEDPPWKVKDRAYRMAGAIVGKRVAFGELTAENAQKLITAWSVP